MQTPSVTILHTLHGRLRLSLSWPPKSVEKLKEDVIGHTGIDSLTYNPITKSILIYYNPSEVDASEILIRVALSVSLDYDLIPIEIITKPTYKGLSTIDQYAGISLLTAWISSFLKASTDLQKMLRWNATLSTIVSVLHHAWIEAKGRGVYDPEVLSVAYLINSMSKENFLPAATGTWLTTFGRHLMESSGENMILQAFKVHDEDKESAYYDVAIIPKRHIRDRRDMTSKLIASMTKSIGGESGQIGWMKQMKNVSRSHGDILEGIGKLDNRIFLRLKY